MEFHKGRAFAKFLLLLSLFFIVFAIVASTAQLWFLPPSRLGSAWTPPHLWVYDQLWNTAREVARWGLSQGLFPEEIRQFKSQGVPAFLPWLFLAGGMLFLASLVGLASLFFPSSARTLRHEAEPTLTAGSVEPRPQPTPEQALVNTSLPSHAQATVQSPGPVPAAPRPVSAEPPDQSHATIPKRSRPVPPAAQDHGDAFGKLVEESLLYSEAQLAHAQESVERLRRALVNVYLDAGSTATEDMQDLRTSIEDLEITLETLKGEQHRVMAALVSQATSPNVAATPH